MAEPSPKRSDAADPDVAQSPEGDKEADTNEGQMDHDPNEVDVKEQDRWLPIANGMCNS